MGKKSIQTNHSCKGYLIFCLGGLGFGKIGLPFLITWLLGAAREEYSQKGTLKYIAWHNEDVAL